MFNIVLFEPEIPANTGNIGRTCVVTGTRLHLIGPLGFSLDDRMLHRAGLGYWQNLDVTTYSSWDDFVEKNNLADSSESPRLHFLTKKACKTYAEADYRDGDYIVFGKESSGLPEELLAAHPDRCERIPMLPDHASLSNASEWEAANEELNGSGHGGAGTGGAGGEGDAANEGGSSSPLLRQDICGNFVDVNDYRISALNLSNSAAIVLYEALRQTGFAGM